VSPKLRYGFEVDRVAVARSVMVLAPIVLLALISGKSIWLSTAIVTISSFIAMERSGLAPLGVVLHGLAISVGYIALLASQATPSLFVACCALLAVAPIRLPGQDERLRSAGSFTFIPSLYLACETEEWSMRGTPLHRGVHFLPMMLVALVPVLVLSAMEHLKDRVADTSYRQHFGRMLRWEMENGAQPYAEAMITVILAVAVAAATVVWRHLDHGQWVIWSAASVITGDLASGRKKMWDRLAGATIGVPAGIGAGLLLPHGHFAYGLVSLAGILTLVALRPYVFAFGTRCAFVSLALVLTGETALTAAERASHVFLGGLIGIALTIGVRIVERGTIRRKVMWTRLCAVYKTLMTKLRLWIRSNGGRCSNCNRQCLFEGNIGNYHNPRADRPALEVIGEFTTCAAKLYWIALVLTGDEKTAARATESGIDGVANSRTVFGDWLCAWSVRDVIEACVALREEDLRIEEGSGVYWRAKRVEGSTIAVQLAPLSTERLRRALLLLPLFPRFVYVLRVLEGYSLPNVASILHVDKEACQAALDYSFGAFAQALMPFASL
jgi:hypothetical protein